MEKSQILSPKQIIIKNLSQEMDLPEKTIELIISHEFNGALDALYNNSSIEISGFGKFYFNKNKAVRKLNSFLMKEVILKDVIANEKVNEKKRKTTAYKLSKMKEDMEWLKHKIDKANENQF